MSVFRSQATLAGWDVGPGPVPETRHGPGAQSVGEAMSRGAGQMDGPRGGVHPRCGVDHDRRWSAMGRWRGETVE